MNRKWFVFLLLALLSGAAWGQESRDWDSFVEAYSDILGEDTGDAFTDEDQMNDLFEIYSNPLNLNDLNEEQLRKLPFIDEIQVLDLLAYIQKNRPLLSTGELMAVTTLDYRARRLLQMFTYAGEMAPEKHSISDAWRRSKNELTVRTDIPLYTKMGYAKYDEATLEKSPNKVYQGTQPYYSLRYTFSTLNKLEAGLMLEKDGGEKGIDYWSAYVVAHNLGRIKTLALGKFRAQFGLGLVMNTQSSFGKVMTLSSLASMDRGFRKHSSMSESGYLTGGGITVNIGGGLEASAFASSSKIDGTVRKDTAAVSSLKTDGLHRTELEISKKGNLTKNDFGGNIAWQWNRLRLSATLVYTNFSMPLAPKYNTEASLYRYYNARGDHFLNYGLAYRYIGRKITFMGETALGEGGGVGTLNCLSTELGSTKLTLIQRYYSAKYVSINGKTFSENSRPQNESGVYLGVNHRFSRKWNVEGYVDVMYFPWLKYQVSGSSYGVDALAQANYDDGKRHSLNVRYRMKSKQRNVKIEGEDDETQVQLHFNTTQSLRLQHGFTLNKHLRLKTTLTGSSASRKDTGTKWGFAASETATLSGIWKHKKPLREGQEREFYDDKWSVSLTASYFHTDDYSARIYIYEPTMLYSFGMRALYYHGVRAALVAKVPLLHNLSLIAKVAGTRYFDRSSIGTGLDLVPHNHKEDIQLQLRWKF